MKSPEYHRTSRFRARLFDLGYDVCFNLGTEFPENTGENYLDVIVDERAFMANPSAKQHNQNKTESEINFLDAAINYFGSRAALLCASEIKDENARELFQTATGLLAKAKVLKRQQTSFKSFDQKINQNLEPSNDKSDDYDDNEGLLFS
ncbi:unnamed protein product [Adineta ricciae]|uniref:Uncharacterized protein n=1 Tax=Adineta ricciae TaxID=249248 RepID=A0A816DYI7_ADIRI|nr:unnamed protein product [Adineta ricciae]